MTAIEPYTNNQGNTVSVTEDYGIHHISVKSTEYGSYFANERKLTAQCRAAARKLLGKATMVSSGGSVKPSEFVIFTGVFVKDVD